MQLTPSMSSVLINAGLVPLGTLRLQVVACFARSAASTSAWWGIRISIACPGPVWRKPTRLVLPMPLRLLLRPRRDGLRPDRLTPRHARSLALVAGSVRPPALSCFFGCRGHTLSRQVQPLQSCLLVELFDLLMPSRDRLSGCRSSR